MAKKKPKKDSKKDGKQADEQKAAKQRAAAETKARARAAALADEAKQARKAADKAQKAAVRAEGRAADAARAAGRPTPTSKPDETELLKLALRTTEAKLTDAERRVEALQQQSADRARLDDDQVEEALEDAIVDAAVQATVAEAVVDAELVAEPFTTDIAAVEAVAAELDEIAAEAQLVDETTHDGDAAAAAEVFESSDGDAGAGATDAEPDADADAEPTVATDEMTPPLPESQPEGEPNESWTLLQLRQEAKHRGLTGTSNLPKAALLDRLRTV